MKKLAIILMVLFTASCKSPEARYPISQNSGSYISESIERNRELIAKEETYIQKLIKEDSAHQYIASNDGFWYYYNVKNNDSTKTETPEFGDIVEFDHQISTVDGKTIYAKGEKPTKSYAVDKEKLFSGLRQGIKLMKEGETVTFLFPSHKGYGYYGDKNKIGTNIPLKTKVTLHKIEEEEKQNEPNN